jgi:hypothetical protein
MVEMKAIFTKHLGPAHTLGSRVKADDHDGNTVTLSWDHGTCSEFNHELAAVALCKKMGWYGALWAGHDAKGGMVFVWEDLKGFGSDWGRVVVD